MEKIALQEKEDGQDAMRALANFLDTLTSILAMIYPLIDKAIDKELKK